MDLFWIISMIYVIAQSGYLYPVSGPAGGENEKDKEDDAVAELTVKKARTDDSTPESTGTGNWFNATIMWWLLLNNYFLQ